MLSIIPAVRSALERLGVTRVGLIGTRVAMTTRVYGALDGSDVLTPGDDDFDATEREYLGMGTTGAATEAQRSFFYRVGGALYREGAEVIVLAGTDLFLVFDGRDCGFPTLDCAVAHIQAITARTLEE